MALSFHLVPLVLVVEGKFVAVQLNQIGGVQDQAAVVVAMAKPVTGRPRETKEARNARLRLLRWLRI